MMSVYENIMVVLTIIMIVIMICEKKTVPNQHLETAYNTVFEG